MPELTSELILVLALAGSTAVAAALAVSLHASARRRLDALAGTLQAELASLREEVRTGSAATGSLTARLERLAQQLDTDQRHRSPEPAGRGEAGYELAIRLARSGAGTEELVTACGMSRKEAEVVARLHGRPAAAVPAPRDRLAVVPR